MQILFGKNIIPINVPTLADLERRVRVLFRAGEGFSLATINLDHLAKMARDADFATTYAAQDIIVADGRPIVALSRLARRPVELIPGSDMIAPLCQWAASENVRVALVGSTDQALSDAAEYLGALVPGLQIVLTLAPSGTFDPDGAEAEAILAQLNAQGVQLAFLAFGAPKQERLAARGRKLAPAVGFASIGAGLDFLGGHQVRAPLWMRKVALEWLWRALSSPRRMVPRYARCFAILPGQVLRAMQLRGRTPL